MNLTLNTTIYYTFAIRFPHSVSLKTVSLLLRICSHLSISIPLFLIIWIHKAIISQIANFDHWGNHGNILQNFGNKAYTFFISIFYSTILLWKMFWKPQILVKKTNICFQQDTLIFTKTNYQRMKNRSLLAKVWVHARACVCVQEKKSLAWKSKQMTQERTPVICVGLKLTSMKHL